MVPLISFHFWKNYTTINVTFPFRLSLLNVRICSHLLKNGELHFLCSATNAASSATSSFVKLFQTFVRLSLPEFPGKTMFVSKGLH